MGGEFWKELFSRLPDFFFVLAAIIIILIMFSILWWVVIGAKRFSDSIGKENRLITLQEEMIIQKENNKENYDTASQVSRALENAQNYIQYLNKLRRLDDPEMIKLEAEKLIQRIIEALPLDIKHKSGESHRCGLWFEENGELVLINGSTGFPDYYIHNRKLNLNRSIAGKCYRKGETIKCDNVSQDDDWEQNQTSKNKYSALICIPIGTWGVLTIDALDPMKKESVLISELYGRLIDGVMDEMTRAYVYMEAAMDAATAMDQHQP